MNYFEQGIQLFHAGKHPQAYQAFINAIRDDCECHEAYFMLGTALRMEKKYMLSVSCLKKAVELNPNSSQYHYELGESLRLNLLWDEATEHLKISINLDQTNQSAWHILSNILIVTGQIEKSIYAINKAIELNPRYEYFQWLKVLINLSNGDYDQGFRDYEIRKRLPDRQPAPNCPEWDGKKDLNGKTLLILKEQGFGDVIQFSRFLDLVPKNINFVCAIQQDLLSLFQENFPDITFYSFKNQPKTDYYILIGDLINILEWGRTPETLPFKKFNIEKTIPIPIPDGTIKKIGITWFGSKSHQNNDVRSADLETFYENLCGVGIELYSLQIGVEKNDPALIGKMGLIHDMAPMIKDFSDTAAILKQLDYLVSVDTSIVHLAGSLGIPCGVIISKFNVDFRWLHIRTDTPWYPSVKLYRQQKEESLDSVLQKIKQDILNGDFKNG